MDGFFVSEEVRQTGRLRGLLTALQTNNLFTKPGDENSETCMGLVYTMKAMQCPSADKIPMNKRQLLHYSACPFRSKALFKMEQKLAATQTVQTPAQMRMQSTHCHKSSATHSYLQNSILLQWTSFGEIMLVAAGGAFNRFLFIELCTVTSSESSEPCLKSQFWFGVEEMCVTVELLSRYFSQYQKYLRMEGNCCVIPFQACSLHISFPVLWAALLFLQSLLDAMLLLWKET